MATGSELAASRAAPRVGSDLTDPTDRSTRRVAADRLVNDPPTDDGPAATADASRNSAEDPVPTPDRPRRSAAAAIWGAWRWLPAELVSGTATLNVSGALDIRDARFVVEDANAFSLSDPDFSLEFDSTQPILLSVGGGTDMGRSVGLVDIVAPWSGDRDATFYADAHGNEDRCEVRVRRADRERFLADVVCLGMLGDIVRYETGEIVADDQPAIDVHVTLDLELSPWPWR